MFCALVLQFFMSLELFQNKSKGGDLFLSPNTMYGEHKTKLHSAIQIYIFVYMYTYCNTK